MKIQESGEMYLETILILSEDKNDIHAIDICDRMGFSKPSVSHAMGLLREAGYIVVDASGHISLTESGSNIARKIYERHRLLTDFLTSIGVNETIAAEDACKIEHDISEESFAALKKALEKSNRG